MDKIISKVDWLYLNPKNLKGIGVIHLEDGELLYVKSLGLGLIIITEAEFVDISNKIENVIKESIVWQTKL